VNLSTTELIQTSRLDLHLISVEDLITLFEDPESFSIPESAGYQNPYGVLIKSSGPLRWRVPQVKRDPALNKWFVRFIVVRETKEVVGSISFHAKPDDDGMIEIGLGVEPACQNNGYATEALAGMWRWVCTQPGVLTLRYTVSPDNAPSQRIIQKFGFTHVGVQIDDEDGPEDIYEMSAADFLARFPV
jgi:[ribosomal protein S5]-alanine N-acetyltransferase